MNWLILILGIASNASASVLIKVATMPPRRFPRLEDPIGALSNWPFWCGLALYGMAFLFYAAALTRLPLNVAQPVMTAGAISAVSLCSFLIFRESFPWTTLLGILMVVAGVILITLKVGQVR